jgi:anti-anti-sigma factor
LITEERFLHVSYREERTKLADDSHRTRHSTPSRAVVSGERLFIFEEAITDVEGGVVVRLEGDITPTCTGDVEQFLDRLIAEDRHQMVIDLSAVSYVCSAGWGVFLGRVKDVRKTGGDIIFAGLRPEVLEVFELLEANRIFRVFGPEGEAIRAFHRGSVSRQDHSTDRLKPQDSLPKKRRPRRL